MSSATEILQQRGIRSVSGYGVRSDGKILFINASTCDINYRPCNPAIVFDVSLPPGHCRAGV